MLQKISNYAYGTDYHYVIKDKLKKLLQIINNKIGEINGRVFVDSAPVMEKSLGCRSGLGWQGKNTNLISKEAGSFFFIAELIVDLELEYDTPVTDHCGSCTACIDACPTEALTPYQIDASKCISYLTIELKDQIPKAFKNKWMIGFLVATFVRMYVHGTVFQSNIMNPFLIQSLKLLNIPTRIGRK